MKKLLATIALITCTLCSAPVFAEISLSDFHLSVEPLFGMRYGELGEYVLLKTSNYASDKLSELDWEIKPLWYAGAQVAGGWKAAELSAKVAVAVPGKTGIMYDSDWQNVSLAGAEDYQYKTNYSESDNYLTKNISWGVSAGWRFNVTPAFSLKPFIAYDYDYIAFDGKGLSGWYASVVNGHYTEYTDEEHRTYKSDDADKTVISYKRESNILWLGAEATVAFSHGVACIFGGQLSPYIATVSIDDHYQNNGVNARGTEYADVCSGYFSALKLYTAVDYAFTRQVSLSLFGSYFFYFQTLRGDNYAKIIGDATYTKTASADGGASIWLFDAGLSVKYTFF